jgi:hypothetical protein
MVGREVLPLVPNQEVMVTPYQPPVEVRLEVEQEVGAVVEA